MMDKIEALTRAMWNIDESLIQECLDADEETDKVSSASKARKRPAKKRLLWAAGIAAAVLLSGITTYAVTDLYRKYKPYEYFFKNGEVVHNAVGGMAPKQFEALISQVLG